LASYGGSLTDAHRLTGVDARRVLKGATARVTSRRAHRWDYSGRRA